MTGSALKKFTKSVAVNSAGELTVNAGRYSRAAVIMAFEMNGGIQGFAEWAEENPSEFYTKLFGKLIGRETEVTKADDVEDLLSVLDGECEEITEAEVITADEMAIIKDPFEPTQRDLRMARAASQYADAEPLD